MASPPRQPLGETALPGLNANGHLHLPKGIFADEVRVTLVDALHENVRVWHAWVCEEQEFRAAEGLENGEAEEGRFERLDP